MRREPSALEAPAGRRPDASTRERLVGLSCGVLSVLLFSSFTLVSRRGLSSALGLPDLAALRFGVGGALLLPFLLRRGTRRAAWRDASALALLGGVGFALLAYAGFSLAAAAHGAVLLHGTLPLFTHAIVSATAGGRRAPRRTAGRALIAAGFGGRRERATARGRRLPPPRVALLVVLWRAVAPHRPATRDHGGDRRGALLRRLPSGLCGV